MLYNLGKQAFGLRGVSCWKKLRTLTKSADYVEHKLFWQRFLIVAALACINNGAMMLAAHSLGLGSCWINRAREEFEMPEWQEWLKSIGIKGDYAGIGHLSVGYPAEGYPQAHPRKPNRVFYVK